MYLQHAVPLPLLWHHAQLLVLLEGILHGAGTFWIYATLIHLVCTDHWHRIHLSNLGILRTPAKKNFELTNLPYLRVILLATQVLHVAFLAGIGLILSVSSARDMNKINRRESTLQSHFHHFPNILCVNRMLYLLSKTNWQKPEAKTVNGKVTVMACSAEWKRNHATLNT